MDVPSPQPPESNSPAVSVAVAERAAIHFAGAILYNKTPVRISQQGRLTAMMKHAGLCWAMLICMAMGAAVAAEVRLIEEYSAYADRMRTTTYGAYPTGTVPTVPSWALNTVAGTSPSRPGQSPDRSMSALLHFWQVASGNRRS